MNEEFKIEKLVKLLALTSSTNDPEAISAMRKANELLNSSGKSWGEVIEDKSAAELADLKPKFTQLINAYRALEEKYKILYSQAAALAYRPIAQSGYRRRSRRL